MIRIYAANSSNVLTDISAYVNLQTPGVISVTENAEEQSVGSSTITFEDPTGTLDLVGLRDIVIDDDLATFKRIWRGQLGARRVTRGNFRAGSKARIWQADLLDLNTRMAWRVGEGNVSRPAETDVARMQYLMTQLVITDIVQDTSTYVDTSNPVAMDAANYAGQYISDYINDCMQAAQKNCYLLNVTGGSSGYQIAIWYGPATLSTYSATSKISNVLADVTSTVFPPYIDGQLERGPDRVYSGVHVNYDGGFVYVTRGATASVFFATRDTIYDAVNVKSSAKATSRGNSQLTTMSTEDDVITCTIKVDSAHVNDIRAGMRVQGKFSHFAFTTGNSYDTDTQFRVLNRTVTLVSPPDATGSSIYEVALTLTPWEGVPVPPAITCSTAITGMGATLWDTGDIANGAGGIPPITVPNGFSPPSATQPYLAFFMWEGRRTDTSAITGDAGGIGNYTMTHNTREGNINDQGSIGLFGYQAVAAGATPASPIIEFTPSWTGGFTGGGFMRGLGVLIPTASATPAQVSNITVSASTITFPNPVTAGNMVVVGFIHEGTATSMPGGWTVFGNVQMAIGSGGTQLTLIGKCMTGSEGATISLVDASETHWWTGIEVALDMKIARVNDRPFETLDSASGIGGGTALPSMEDLTDVDVTGITNGQVLVWNGSTWVPSGISTPVTTGTTDHEHVMDVLMNGDGVTTAFELPAAPFDAYSVAAYVAGTLTEVTLSGTLLTTATFGSAPASATNNIRFDIVAAVV